MSFSRGSSVLGRLLPDGFAAVETRVDEPVALYPEEEQAVADAVEMRRREFATTRGCARAALSRLGIQPASLPTGPHREPVWPAGVVGSLTHCAGYRAAAVGRSDAWLAIGVDAEPDEPLPPEVRPLIATESELASLPTDSTVSWDRLLFSAKESVYKAWFPATRRWLDFTDAVVHLDLSGTFTAQVLAADPVVDGLSLEHLQGRWLAEDGLLITALTVPR